MLFTFLLILYHLNIICQFIHFLALYQIIWVFHSLYNYGLGIGQKKLRNLSISCDHFKNVTQEVSLIINPSIIFTTIFFFLFLLFLIIKSNSEFLCILRNHLVPFFQRIQRNTFIHARSITLNHNDRQVQRCLEKSTVSQL